MQKEQSITFSGLELQELTEKLLAVNSRRLPNTSLEKRASIIPNSKMRQALESYLSDLVAPELISDAMAYFLEQQPASLAYPYASTEEITAENVEIISTTLLSALNRVTKRRGRPKQFTSLPNSDLISRMADSLGQFRNESIPTSPPQTKQQELQKFIAKITDNQPISPIQKEFIIVEKLAGIFDPETSDLQQFIKNRQTSPENPVKIDVCPSFGAGTLGQLMPQPQLTVEQGTYGDKGQYQSDKKTRFIKYLQTAIQQANFLAKYGLNCQVVTAEWEMPIRPLLYQAIANLPKEKIKLFGVEPIDLDQILQEYSQVYGNNSILSVSQAFFADVSRRFPEETNAGKIISSLALLEQAGIESESFFRKFTNYLVINWLLPNLEQTGGIDQLLEKINMPFTQYFYTIWSDLYGIGSDYSPNIKDALKRSLRLDYIFYRPQYVFENWLAAQTGFIGVVGNAAEEKKFYGPLNNFAYPKTLPFLPVPDQALMEKI